ncbi:MAG TPA: MDR family MFS transporter [Candidatus Limnocylindria bacterium]|nr:MDR family MFS transporter [Candidatus Limnocylindria bacterium]
MPAEMDRTARVLASVGVGLALFLAALDQTIVGTALPRIVSELNGLEYFAWVATAYMVASTTTVPIAGKLGDLFGRKPLLMLGMVGFVLASALCGQARDMVELVVFRGIQGLFGGVLFASVFASLADLFPPRTRARIQGIFGGIFGVASVLGPTIGGYLTDNVGWRWVFYVNIPVGILALAVVFVTMSRTRHSASWRDIDFLGAGLLAATLVPLLVGFSIMRDHALGSPEVVGLLGFGAVMAVVFFIVEQRVAHPIVPFVLFKNVTFAVSSITGFFSAFGMFGAIVYIGLVYQGVLGIGATNSGLLATPMMVGVIAASLVTGQLMIRVTRYRFLGTIGLTVMVVGLLGLSQVRVGTPEVDVVRDLILIGIGIGMTMPLYINATQSALPREFLGVATSQIQFWRNIGGTVGVAILGAVISYQLPGRIRAQVASLDLPPEVSAALPSGGSAQAIFDPARIAATRAALPSQAQPVFDQVLEATRAALAASLHDVFVYAAVVVAVAVVISLFLKEVSLRGHTARPSDGEVSERAPAFGD